MGGDWSELLRRDIGHLADDRPLPRRHFPESHAHTTVSLSWRYPFYPVLGALSWDVEQFDLAIRRAAYAVHQGIPGDELVKRDIRIPRRQGLRLVGTQQGSLELLLGLPPWIVGALASQPATALANLIALLSAREMIRVQLRRLVLTRTELELLERYQDSVNPHVTLTGAAEDGSADLAPGSLANQGELPRTLEERIHTTEPLVDVEVGGARVRSTRPDVDVVVQEGQQVISVAIRTPRR